MWISIVISLVIVIGLILFILHLVRRVNREKKFRKDLKQNQLELFEKGNIAHLNPEFTLDEQADLLPYDRDYEVDKDNIVFGMNCKLRMSYLKFLSHYFPI